LEAFTKYDTYHEVKAYLEEAEVNTLGYIILASGSESEASIISKDRVGSAHI
jgi:hypothetical protein